MYIYDYIYIYIYISKTDQRLSASVSSQRWPYVAPIPARFKKSFGRADFPIRNLPTRIPESDFPSPCKRAPPVAFLHRPRAGLRGSCQILSQHFRGLNVGMALGGESIGGASLQSRWSQATKPMLCVTLWHDPICCARIAHATADTSFPNTHCPPRKSTPWPPHVPRGKNPSCPRKMKTPDSRGLELYIGLRSGSEKRVFGIVSECEDCSMTWSTNA